MIAKRSFRRLTVLLVAGTIILAAPISRADEPKSDIVSGLNQLIATLLQPGTTGSRGPISRKGTASVEHTARFSADMFKPFIGPEYQPTGTIDAVYQVSGTHKFPQVEARLHIIDGGAAIPGISETLHAITGTATLSSSNLVIHEISGKLGEGTFRLAGRMNLEQQNLKSVELTFTSSEFPITIPGVIEARVGGRLRLSGPLEAPRLTGEIRLISGTWVRDTAVTPVSRSMETETLALPAPKPVSSETGFFERVTLDIQVIHQEPFWVDNNLARFSLVPELRIRGTARHPVLAGRALVEEGEISYQNKRFEIEKGGVEFTDPYKTDPVVNLTGKGKFRKWLVSLSFTGPPEALNLTLSSEPPLEEPDIISLLVVGRTSEDLIAKEGGSPVSTSKVLAGLIDSEYGAKFKKTTGLDILEAENIPDKDMNGQDRVRFTVGENLSRRMTLKYATETRKGMFIQEFISEYKLLDKLLMSGYQDTEGAYGAGLLYRMEFK